LLDKADFMAPNHSGRDLRYRVEGFPANHKRAVDKDAPTGVLLRKMNGLEPGMFCESRGMPARARTSYEKHTDTYLLQ
jgi:hypothetical protein